MDGAATLGTGTLNAAGVATFTTATLSVGHHNVTAVYGGDASFNASTSTSVDQEVQKADTTTVLTSSTNPSKVGQPVTFTATVTVQAPGAGTPTGTVTFMDGATTLGTGTLTGAGVATFMTPRWRWAITTSRRSTAVMRASTGARRPAWTRRCRRRTPRPSLTSSANPSRFGQSVTFTATVTVQAPGAGTASGTVTFKDGATTLGTGTLTGAGIATFMTATLTVGHHNITAVYGGDASFNGSTSTSVDQEVQKADTATALTSSANPSKIGQSVTFTATVTCRGAGIRRPYRISYI